MMRSIIYKLSNLGVCVTYNRVLSVSTSKENSVSEKHSTENFVCQATLKKGVCTITRFPQPANNKIP